jgi:O-methyltransferase
LHSKKAYIDLLKLSLMDLLGPSTTRAVRQRDGTFIVEEVPEEDRARRLVGRDWPANGVTMIGLERLNNLQQCVRRVIADGVPGDFIEAGAWRGGATILMRALLALHDDPDRKVWVADSFSGLPEPDPESYPADAGDRHHTYEFLRVSLEDVKRNFDRYGFLDERVRFVEGWFRDTLPKLEDERWALVRIDGDMYESTRVALDSLYPNLSPGGFVILDDSGAVPGCKQAIEDFRAENDISDELQRIDWTGVFWRKESS